MPIIKKNIRGTNRVFGISFSGKIIRWDGPVMEVIPPIKNKSDHLLVKLDLDKKSIYKRLDKLVLKHFIGESPSDNHTEVIHIDGDKSNCMDINLKWATKRELEIHTLNLEQQKKIIPGKSKKVIAINTRNNKSYKYKSPKDAEIDLGINATRIRRAIRQKEIIGDFKFKYLP